MWQWMKEVVRKYWRTLVESGPSLDELPQNEPLALATFLDFRVRVAPRLNFLSLLLHGTDKGLSDHSLHVRYSTIMCFQCMLHFVKWSSWCFITPRGI